MDGMRPPELPKQPVQVIRAERLAWLLKTCQGRDFASRRDIASIRLLVDTGMRRAECVGMTVGDVDVDQRIVWVVGKGRRPRALPSAARPPRRWTATCGSGRGIGWRTYPQVWGWPQRADATLGDLQVVDDRARTAGLPAMHPHQLRHAFATSWLAEGGNQNELMLVAGWKSRTMIDRYTKATAVERARASHARLSPADRL
jgi:site-specific recombinase XerD